MFRSGFKPSDGVLKPFAGQKLQKSMNLNPAVHWILGGGYA